MSLNMATSEAAVPVNGTLTIEIEGSRNADLKLGLWATDDELEQQFLVFDDRGSKKAFLLTNLWGQPAYTCVSLRSLDISAFYVSEVEIWIDTCLPNTTADASIGKLSVRQGRGFVTTIDQDGKPLEVQIAPLHLAVEDGDYGFYWSLTDQEYSYPSAEYGPILHFATPRNSWLNEWQSPYANFNGSN